MNQPEAITDPPPLSNDDVTKIMLQAVECVCSDALAYHRLHTAYSPDCRKQATTGIERAQGVLRWVREIQREGQ